MEIFFRRAAQASLALGAIVSFTACTAANPLVTRTQKAHEAKVAAIPKCARKLGTISVIEPEGDVHWWTQQQLPSPTKLIKVFVNKSGCFTLLDRGMGMSAAMRERALAAGGELRGGANIGKGQVKAADYVMVPDLVSTNANAGGSALSALASGLIGGGTGRLVGSINISSKTSDVVLTVTDVRSSEQVAMTEGHGEKNDIGLGASGKFFGSQGLGGAGIGGYANTTIGQVISMAYLDAYTKLVNEMGGMPGNASAANARQSGTVRVATRMFSNAGMKGQAVRSLDPGMTVYPTGDKVGLIWEIEDEHGNRGWISSENFDLAR
ncbi:curli biogenesis system outer membrane secretion channel CsgG [Luteibacter sp. OK325]|uniref:CsgG/HfaB family protein n=1 Tax=Luteibacter sp. OK325 TaxID=2135670 RepID=UPI000D399299|nr:CsgG/HfaB family protein [Luteibacter sp. OK325]PTR24737.1 curli biogenesis system outer membrane secretion channel CsgG [Luteibacter sp. OK325]